MENPVDALPKKNLLDTLPDEILQLVLIRAVEKPKSDIFVPEREFSFWDDDIPHRAHCLDWIILNSTNRRIRRMSEEVFFQTRCVAMRWGLFQTLQQRQQTGNLPPPLRLIEGGSPSHLLHLPRHLALFSRLRSCVLLYDGSVWEGYRSIAAAIKSATNGEPPGGSDANAAKLSKLEGLLHDIGVSGQVRMDFAFTFAVDLEQYFDLMTKATFPILRFKAKTMKKLREREEATVPTGS
ncbi:hypothetical protein F4778DRAFT_788598 [Xylariomycetidae sp. FL2044]|nr:hypothetical protein F4778DRAFT_788598 [Xylariomycetidae sp. FL2044]